MRSPRPTSRSASDDGLPETLEEVIAAWGHRYFKLKVGGQIDADLARLEAIAAVLDRLPDPYFVSLDGNEQYADAQGVAELVAGIRARPALARLWNSILFIEQPIARKLALDTDLRRADLGKPVIIDESDGELDTFVQARERGYLGVSSKTCKGLYKSLLNAARCAHWNARGRDGALLHVGRGPHHAGRPVGAAGPGAGQPAGHHATSSATATTTSTAWRRSRQRNRMPSWPRIPTCTSAATARCG